MLVVWLSHGCGGMPGTCTPRTDYGGLLEGSCPRASHACALIQSHVQHPQRSPHTLRTGPAPCIANGFRPYALLLCSR